MFQLPKLLSLFTNMLMHSQLHFIKVLLIYLPCLPHCQTLLSFRRTFTTLHVHPRCELHLFSIHQSLLKIIPNRHMHQPIVEKHSLISIMISHLVLVLVCTEETTVSLSILNSHNSL